VFRALRHLRSIVRIGWHLARHDALFPLRNIVGLTPFLRVARWVRPPAGEVRGLREGQRLALALRQLGPSFIKLGQALSTRSDLIGEEVAADLSGLQDNVPPFPGALAVEVIEAEMGVPLGERFSRFDEVAIAAASVAQVHFAVTTEGREVAVKVLRPGVEQAFARDLDLLLWLAEQLERFQTMRRLRPVEVVGRLAESVAFEMDLRLEAAAAAELAENFSGEPDFRVPSIDWLRTGRRVLVSERIYGIPVGDRAALQAAGLDPKEIIRKAAAAFFAMVFRDGFFHADLHPGNLFVAPDGAIVAVDFGIMGRLDRKHRFYLADMLLGFLTGNYRQVAQVHFDAGFVPPGESIDAFTQACRSIGEPLMGQPLEKISVARLLSQLFQITRTFKMETQPQLLMLQKTMVLAEGLGRILDPSVNMWTLARPLIEEWMIVHRSGPARAILTASEALAGLERLPTLMGDFELLLRQLSHGGLALSPDTVRAIRGDGGGRNPMIWPLWIAALALAALAIAQWVAVAP
jgi:ubiquinone biosynthesis protein